MRPLLHGPPSPPAATATLLLSLGILDRFIDGQDETGGLGGCCQGVDLHHGWLPHTRSHVVSYVFTENVHAIPRAT